MNSEILDRVPPSDTAIESQLLGSVLLGPDCLDELVGMVRESDFYANANGLLYSRLVQMHAENRRIDIPLLLDRLKSGGDLEAIGGPAYLAEVIESVAVAAHWKHYAQIVVKHARKRALIHAACDVLQRAYDDGSEPDDIREGLEVSLQKIAAGSYETKPVSISTALVEVFSLIDQITKSDKTPGIHIGLEQFDRDIGGVFPGELTILAARPGQGKTSLALQMAAYTSMNGVPTYLASLEMANKELALKRLCSVSNVSQQIVRTGRLTQRDREKMLEAAQSVAAENWFLHDASKITVQRIRSAARAVKAGIVFVDYLQIVSPPDRQKKRYEQVGEIAHALKTMARDLNVPVVACCQIGRSADNNKDGRPAVKDLRESGDIENNADMIMLLFRPKGGIKGGWSADLTLAKNRLGAVGNFPLDWDGPTTMFTSRNKPENTDESEEENEEQSFF